MKSTLVTFSIGMFLVLIFFGSLAEADVAVFDIEINGWSKKRYITGGWQFVLSNPISVTHLGLWDDMFDAGILGVADTTEGFAYEIPIGIWRVSDQALLTSTTLGPGTINPALDEFRYAEISPVLLSEGETYAIGFQYGNSFSESDWFQKPTPDGFQIDPAITYVMEVWSSENGFRFPDIGHINDYPNTCFGPNFQFEVVPVPGAFLLGSIGLVFGSWRLRKRKEL